MPISGSSVLSWSHWALTVAAQTGSRLLAHVAAVSGDGQPAEQRGEPAAPGRVASRPAQSPSPSPATAAGRVPEIAAAPEVRRRLAGRARAMSTSVTPAMVRRWAHERGIQVAERGRIPRSVMERYVVEMTGVATGSGSTSGGSSNKARPRGPSRFSAA